MYLEEINLNHYILKDFKNIMYIIFTLYILFLTIKLNYNFMSFCFKNNIIKFNSYLHIPLFICIFIIYYNAIMTLEQILLFIFILFIFSYNYFIINTLIHPIYQPLIAYLIYYCYLNHLEINNLILKINEIINFVNNNNNNINNNNINNN